MTFTTLVSAGQPEHEIPSRRSGLARGSALGVGLVWLFAAIVLAPPVSALISSRWPSGLLVVITLLLAGVTAGVWLWRRLRGLKSQGLGIKAVWQLGSALLAWFLLSPEWRDTGVGIIVSLFYFWRFGRVFSRTRAGNQS